MSEQKLVRFDWAMKNLLRNKSNYDIIEGFLSALLEDNDLKVIEILESETNKEDENDKFNRTDVIVKDGKKRKILIEIQNTKETDYLFRMVYNSSKHISQIIESGEKYSKIDKIILVSILYFNIGLGEDYLYYGQTEFVGLTTNERINKNSPQVQNLIPEGSHYNGLEIFPEYYFIQVNKYQNIVKRAIDEWIYWFKNEKVKVDSHSKNIDKVRQKLNILKMNKDERKRYERYLEKLASERDMVETSKREGYEEAKEIYKTKLKQVEKEKEEAKKREQEAKKREQEAKQKIYESARIMKNSGISTEIIKQATGLTDKDIEKL